jgi:hypothetical protein
MSSATDARRRCETKITQITIATDDADNTENRADHIEIPVPTKLKSKRISKPVARSREPGAWSLEPGARSLEPGARSPEPGAWSP